MGDARRMVADAEIDTSAAAAAPPRDFPFYQGLPVRLSLAKWVLILAGCVAGFAILMELGHILPGQVGHLAVVSLFLLVPLLSLRLAAGPHWTALFPRLRARDVWIGLAFAPLTMSVAAMVALLVMHTTVTASNPVGAILATLKGWDLVLFIVSTLPQLLGEEVITVLPFLAILTLVRQGLKTPRLAAIIAAWIGSALIFGALHLSTYGWHLAQALGIITVSRLMLTIPYMLTKNLWSSTIAHVTHDWIIFALILLAVWMTG